MVMREPGSGQDHNEVNAMSRRDARSRIVCPCHDVTQADVENAIDSGHTDPETIKRATAVYMGACQGKFCSPLVQEILKNRGVESAGGQRRPAARLPIVPIPLGALIDLDQLKGAPASSAETPEFDGMAG